ncbi:MAG: hypothetical protein KC496_20280, partial [Anaerolineae bacterium]|nr:hypothetical protein [Anaerolineae bacterium]
TVVARVRILATTPGTVTMSIPGVGESAIVTSDLANNQWMTLRDDFYIGSGSSSDDAPRSIQFTGTAGMTFYVDEVQVIQGSNWAATDNRNYYGGFATASTSHGAQAAFSFQGTGFSIGTAYSRSAGEMQVCWLDYTSPVPSNQEVLVNGNCITYENEYQANIQGASRVVYGLDSSLTYRVVVRDVEDGETVLGRSQGDPRAARYGLGEIVIDWVEIFDQTPPLLTGVGSFNEDAASGINPYLLQLPAESWARQANRRYSEETATAVVDSRGRLLNTASGPIAALNLEIPSGEEATVILDTNSANRRASSQLLACAGGVEGVVTYNPDKTYSLVDNNGIQNCVLLDDMQSNRFVTL